MKGEVYTNASALGGSVTLEFCDTSEQVNEGFSCSHYVLFTDDCITAKVEWKGKPDLGRLERKVIRVKVRARNAKLYSFFFPKGSIWAGIGSSTEISCLDPLQFDL